MLLHVDVRNDVVVLEGVLARAEVPRLLLGVVVTLLQALQFVLEVDDVVGLLVPQGSVLVLGQHVGHVLLLGPFNCFLGAGVLVDLRDGVVERFLFFDEFAGNFLVGGLFALKILLLFDVVVDVLLPLGVALGQIVLLRKLPNICNRRHNLFNYF